MRLRSKQSDKGNQPETFPPTIRHLSFTVITTREQASIRLRTG